MSPPGARSGVGSSVPRVPRDRCAPLPAGRDQLPRTVEGETVHGRVGCAPRGSPLPGGGVDAQHSSVRAEGDQATVAGGRHRGREDVPAQRGTRAGCQIRELRIAVLSTVRIRCEPPTNWALARKSSAAAGPRDGGSRPARGDVPDPRPAWLPSTTTSRLPSGLNAAVVTVSVAFPYCFTSPVRVSQTTAPPFAFAPATKRPSGSRASSRRRGRRATTGRRGRGCRRSEA